MLILLAILASCTAYILMGALTARLAVTAWVNKNCTCVALNPDGTHTNAYCDLEDKYPVAILSFLLWPLVIFVPIVMFATKPTIMEKSMATRAQLKEMEEEVEKLKKEYNL